MTKYYIFLFLLCISKHIKAQDNSIDLEGLLYKSHAERTLILTPFYEQGILNLDSLTVFSTIKTIEDLAKKNRDYELTLEARLMRVHYYMYRKYFDKELVVTKAKTLIELAKKDNVLWLEIRAESLLANYLYYMHQDYGNGVEHFERTAQLLEEVSGENFPLKQICIYQLAKVYFQFKEHKKAIKLLRTSENTTSVLNSYYYKMHIINTLGGSYRQLKKMDSSFFYYNKTLDKAIAKGDIIWEGISSGNLGYNYFLEGNLKKAKPLITKNLNIAEENKDWGLACSALSNLARIAIAENEIEKAQLYIEKAQQFALKSKQYRRLVNIYKIKSKLAAFGPKPELTAKYLDSLLIVKDSLARIFNSKKIVLAKQRILIEKKKIQDERNLLLNARRLYRRNGIIVVLVLLLFIGLLLYNRKKLRHKNKVLVLDSEKQLALQKLSLASKRLDDFKVAIFNKNNTIKHLKKVLISSRDTDEKSQSIHKKIEEIAILTEKDWREFVALFEEVHFGFFNRLKAAFPYLTPSETKLMAISRLQLDNKEMALMLGVGTSAIRQAKSRLRKKITLQEDQSLKELAASI